MTGTSLYNEIFVLPSLFNYPSADARLNESDSVERLLPDVDVEYSRKGNGNVGYPYGYGVGTNDD